MKSISTLKYLPRRLLVLYSCCLSIFFLCAFYTYSVTRTGSNRPEEDRLITDNTGKVEQLSETALESQEDIKQRKALKSLQEVFSPQENRFESMTVQNLQQPSSIETNNLFSDDQYSFSIVSDDPDRQPRSFIGHKAPDKNPPKFKDSVDRQNLDTDNKVHEIEVVNSTFCSAGKPKLILLWTPFFQEWNYLTNDSFDRCKRCKNCLITTDRNMLLASDALIFHIRDLNIADLPAQRLPHQRWIFYCLESPSYSYFAGFEFMHKMFNWTMTYRLDSDIISEYGLVKKVYPRRSLNMFSLRGTWSQKSKSVIWMTSHCPTYGGRDNYVKQLKKYIDVDEYGKCGQLDCPRNATSDCLQKFAKTYKFYLAFENSICKDYVTEKFFRTLFYDMVPVVFGGASYRKVAPPGSYIDALSFKSPKHLAFFLAGVGKDFDLYSTYFQWRKDFVVKLDSARNCVLCSQLHQNTEHKVYEDMRKWWVQNGTCRVWKPRIALR